jgi:hypothetical protein
MHGLSLSHSPTHTFVLTLSLRAPTALPPLPTHPWSPQDSTFLFTEPRQTCLGLWLALEDATVDNGCVWARPGSHKEPLRRQFYRNPAHFGTAGGAEGAVAGDPSAPQMLFEDFVGPEEEGGVAWEGTLPAGVPQDQAARDAGFVPAECKKVRRGGEGGGGGGGGGGCKVGGV